MTEINHAQRQLDWYNHIPEHMYPFSENDFEIIPFVRSYRNTVITSELEQAAFRYGIRKYRLLKQHVDRSLVSLMPRDISNICVGYWDLEG